MSREKQIEEMACKNCIHYEVCMYVNAQAVEYARAENCKLFKNNAGYRKQSHGTWYHGTENGYDYAKCSACGRRMNIFLYGYAHCALCGARMDGAKMKGGAE